jgi:ketosteroid isomerase-like protein
MAPNVAAKTGTELRQWLNDFLRSVSVQWLKFVHVETVAVGDFAFHVFACSWRVTPKAGGESKVLHFKGLHVLRRGADGVWRIHREIWNMNPERTEGL